MKPQQIIIAPFLTYATLISCGVQQVHNAKENSSEQIIDATIADVVKNNLDLTGIISPEIEVFNGEGKQAVFNKGSVLFLNRSYTLSTAPAELIGKTFLQSNLESSRFRIKTNGTLIVLTQQNGESNSIANQLVNYGFSIANNTSFQLFGSNPNDKVITWQKPVKTGEFFELKSWSVVVGIKSVSNNLAANYLKAPNIIINPSDSYYKNRNYQGIPSIAEDIKGNLWAVWYGGGVTEDKDNYIIAVQSTDKGQTWSNEKIIIDPDKGGEVRAFDPQVWKDPQGKLWFFWAQEATLANSVAGVWAATITGYSPLTLSKPVRLTDGVMMNKPIVLSTGAWAMPVSTSRSTYSWLKDNSSKIAISNDLGKNWFVKEGVNIPLSERNADENMIVELKNGKLWMLVRLRTGIGETFSSDKGLTWSTLTKSTAILHTPSRFFISRLPSGNLLLIKHGKIDEVTSSRKNLTAHLSSDDGKNWSNALLFDSNTNISYPDAIACSDGKIRVVYDHNRYSSQEIFMSFFSENDIKQNKKNPIIKINK